MASCVPFVAAADARRGQQRRTRRACRQGRGDHRAGKPGCGLGDLLAAGGRPAGRSLSARLAGRPELTRGGHLLHAHAEHELLERECLSDALAELGPAERERRSLERLCHLSAGGGGTDPPVAQTPPAATGSSEQNSVEATDNGSWTNSPTGYTYRWQRENSPGAGRTPTSRARPRTDTSPAAPTSASGSALPSARATPTAAQPPTRIRSARSSSSPASSTTSTVRTARSGHPGPRPPGRTAATPLRRSPAAARSTPPARIKARSATCSVDRSAGR